MALYDKLSLQSQWEVPILGGTMDERKLEKGLTETSGSVASCYLEP